MRYTREAPDVPSPYGFISYTVKKLVCDIISNIRLYRQIAFISAVHKKYAVRRLYQKEKTSMEKQVVLTTQGLKKLEDELEQLKTEKRKEIADKIKVALSFGDLSENSEYDEAKNEQAMVETRIAHLESLLQNVKLIDDDDLNTEAVGVGSKVEVHDIEFDEDTTFQIVGSTEADPDQNLISDEAPVGRTLIGHKVGDEVEVEVPNGTIKYKILSITK